MAKNQPVKETEPQQDTSEIDALKAKIKQLEDDMEEVRRAIGWMFAPNSKMRPTGSKIVELGK